MLVSAFFSLEVAFYTIHLTLQCILNITIIFLLGIMRTNVEKVLERDQKLSELDDRADALQQGASQFEQQAGKLKRKYWWKNIKVYFTILDNYSREFKLMSL